MANNEAYSVYIVYNNLQGSWQTMRLTECLHSLQQSTGLMANNEAYSVYIVYNNLQGSWQTMRLTECLHSLQQSTGLVANKAYRVFT